MSAVPPILEVDRLTVRFGSVAALEDVEFAIQPGESVALAGENGAGKSTLVRCIAGDLSPAAGRISVAGERVPPGSSDTTRHGVAVVWQDISLCDNLDIASNLLLGRERARLFVSDIRLHQRATALLDELGIRLRDTRRVVRTLSSGERQLLAVARAMRDHPRLLVLDEPTASLGVNEASQVEQLAAEVRTRGTSLLIVSHDVDQIFRLTERVVILRHGRLVADLETARCHPDDVVALVSGQQTDASARRQLSRLQTLADRLATADPSSSLQLISSALAAALGTARISIHLRDGAALRVAADVGFPLELRRAWAEVPIGPAGGPLGAAAAREGTVVDHDIRTSEAWAPWRRLADDAHLLSSWAVPIEGADGLIGVIGVFREAAGYPPRDELNLVTLYAGFAAGAVERERLLREVTARNRVLETIRDVLETLAGPVPLAQALAAALHALCEGLQAVEVGLFTQDPAIEPVDSWVVVDAAGRRVPASRSMLSAAQGLVRPIGRHGRAHAVDAGPRGTSLGVSFATPGGSSALVAHWRGRKPPPDATVLLEDAANSLRLAHERQESERARQEASALRRSRELQRDFLSRLSHELRTPLTAIGGYASSLMQPDVTWDGASEHRFLSRIGDESARLNRLVDDLLDFSAIESATLRLQPDWCDLALVLDAARACVLPASSDAVVLSCADGLPVVWGDHDRLEQVFVNLFDNALRHNPAGTTVRVDAVSDGDGRVTVTVTDNGGGIDDDLSATMFELRHRPRTATSGAGLGLSIVKGIVEAHGGSVQVEPLARGTRICIRLPVEREDAHDREMDERELSDV